VRGRRIVLPARDDDGRAIEAGTPVVVVAIERGIARVTALELERPERSSDADAEHPPEVP
jgi:hypothetical protein